MAKSRSTTSAKSWKKRTGGVELDLPSGNVCKVRRPGLDKLLNAGILPDNLTPIAIEMIKVGESGGKPVDEKAAEQKILEEMLSDENAIKDIFLSFDKVTAMCVVDPVVRFHQYTDNDTSIPTGYKVGDDIPESERDEEFLYTDDVDIEDKTFIFNFAVGGSSDLERFRKEYSEGLEDLQSGQDLEMQA